MHLPTSHKAGLRFTAPFLLTATMLLSACGLNSAPARYRETYHLQQLQVVFLDEESLPELYEAQYGRPAIRLAMRAGVPSSISRVKAFYDFQTHTIYCTKWDFENCGHELHHALFGRFHADED